jgi:ferredoxin
MTQQGIHRGCEKCCRIADKIFEEHDAKIAAVERRGADAKRMKMAQPAS